MPDYYVHPDGTRFRRTSSGHWYGSDGSTVSDDYILWRLRIDEMRFV